MKYLAYARAEFLRYFQYRADYWATAGGTVITIAIQWALWNAVYRDAGVIAGLSLTTMLSYSLMGRVVSGFLAEPTGLNLGSRVRSGAIVHDLVKPANLSTLLMFQTLGRALYRLASIGVPCFVVLVAAGLLKLPPLGTVATFAASLVMGYVALFSTYFVSGVLTFYTKTGVRVEHLYPVISLFSGEFLPLEFFPDWLRRIADSLPFKGIYYVPMSLWSGISTPAQALPSLVSQGVWTVGMVTLARLVWAGAVRNLTIQGG
jgi:ABC-2 type transport system permease protein